MRPRSAQVWLFAFFQLWLAHAIGYMAHEYAHSFTAWALHGMANPLALDYGHVNLANLLFLDDVDENVDYRTLFAAGRSHVAGLTAVAGVLFGNGLTYIVSLLLYARAKRKHSRWWALFAFWLCIMSVGNFLGYVPVRTFATHADMAYLAHGFSLSPWAIALGLGLPFAVALVHFFVRILPDAEAFLLPHDLPLQQVLVLLTTYLIFCFFGGSGIRNYGPVSYWLSACCLYLLFPIVTILCWQRPSLNPQPR
jgi:hypothetical protein